MRILLTVIGITIGSIVAVALIPIVLLSPTQAAGSSEPTPTYSVRSTPTPDSTVGVPKNPTPDASETSACRDPNGWGSC